MHCALGRLEDLKMLSVILRVKKEGSSCGVHQLIKITNCFSCAQFMHRLKT